MLNLGYFSNLNLKNYSKRKYDIHLQDKQPEGKRAGYPYLQDSKADYKKWCNKRNLKADKKNKKKK